VIGTFTEFKVTKKTGSYADALVAIGQADLLRFHELNHDGLHQVSIKDNGDSYVLIVKPGINNDDFEEWKPEPGYQYIKVKRDDQDAPIDYYDYEIYREQEKAYREFQKTLGKKAKKVTTELDQQGLESPLPPPDDLSVIKTYNSMRMGSNSYNDMHKALRNSNNLSRLIQTKLGVLKADKPITASEKELQKAASILQLFNPIAGKGTHRPKPDSSAASGFSDKLVDWYEEWMKFRALHLAMLTYSVGDDTKVLVIAPGDIAVNVIKNIRDDLLKNRFYGSVWLDIQNIFQTVKTLIKYSKEYQGNRGLLAFRGKRPNKLIKGFYSTYFKSLGTASAVMNVSFLGLPGWFPINSAQDAQDWLEIIEEHIRCLKSLDENLSSDIPLLLSYRDFLSTGKLEYALDFFVSYGTHFMQRKSQNKWAEAFTLEKLRRLFMSYGLTDIIENPGFKNVAKAIRRATVNAQMRKSITGKTPFEIQYGLAQDWKRKVKFKNQFIIELCNFVQKYNAESARHMEIGKEPRELITDDDLNMVLQLIEDKSSELVGMLLLAYGYAREEKDKGKDE